jgi:hypothetical protein
MRIGNGVVWFVASVAGMGVLGDRAAAQDWEAPPLQGPTGPAYLPPVEPPLEGTPGPLLYGPNSMPPLGPALMYGPPPAWEPLPPQVMLGPPAPEIDPAVPLLNETENWRSTVLPPPSSLPPEYPFLDWSYWFPTDGWSSTFELGINGTSGNAETFSLRTGSRAQRKVDGTQFTVDMKYERTLANSVMTQHNALLNSNLESNLGDTPWTAFFKTNLEYDEFKAFDLRAVANAGLGYHLIKTDDAKFIVRFGSGVSRELGGPKDEYIPEAVYGAEFDRKINKRQKFYGTFDYFPNWSDYSDFRMVTNAGWEFLLDEGGNLSLKLAAIDRYDSTPHGRKPNDLDYSLLLLWKH